MGNLDDFKLEYELPKDEPKPYNLTVTGSILALMVVALLIYLGTRK